MVDPESGDFPPHWHDDSSADAFIYHADHACGLFCGRG